MNPGLSVPPYSLAPSNYWLFSEVKITIKRDRMTMDKIKENMRQLMATMEEDFADCSEKWKGFWVKYLIEVN